MPVPDHIDTATIEQLPTGPGVYYFIDQNGAILYVGKSIHIKQRVLSHFYASSRDEKEKKLAFATHDIRFTSTAGELSALLLESREIKQHNPVFNRRLRRYRKLYSWQLSEDSEQLSPTLVAAQWPPVLGKHIYGLYRSRTQANSVLRDLANTHHLCRKILGLEKSSRGCFNLQLKRCRGACIGNESLASHNRRLQQALTSHDALVWPYPNAIALREQPTTALLVFHRYYFLGHATDIEGAQTLLAKPDPHLLDLDSYRILLRFLGGNTPSAHVVLLPAAVPTDLSPESDGNNR
jgi:DNA polymerase III subunit epsilon